jgi:hypothetical protein
MSASLLRLVKSLGPDALDDFERRTFAAWDRASLGDLRPAIERLMQVADARRPR